MDIKNQLYTSAEWLEALKMYFSDMWTDAWNKVMLPLGGIMSGIGMSNIDLTYRVVIGTLGVLILLATLIHWILKIQTQISIRNKARDEQHILEIEKEIREEEKGDDNEGLL